MSTDLARIKTRAAEPSMRIVQIPILSDNYCHLVVDDATGRAAVIDPAEPSRVIPVIEKSGAKLTHILCTHHHWDHAGGNLEMLARFPEARVVGSVGDAAKIPGATDRVADGDTVRVGDLEARVLFVPCHTRGHVAYLFGDALFCGDTLFVAGCGRFFEGDAAQMHTALNTVFAGLAPQTRVFCGHEYTVSNLKFAVSIEPDNAAAKTKLAWAELQRADGRSTVPSTIGEERTYNPFMRLDEPTVQATTGAHDPVAVMSALRERKNGFREP